MPGGAGAGGGGGSGKLSRDDVTGQAARSHGAVLVMVNLAFTPRGEESLQGFEQKNDMI